MTDGFILWNDVIAAIPDLDQRIERARFAIRRGGDRFTVVSVAHADIRWASPSPCIAAVALGVFDDALADVAPERRVPDAA